MRTSRIKTKLLQNQPAICTTLTLACPELFELVSLFGFDAIWLDMEHHQHSVETASQLIRAARIGNADVVARPGKGEFMRMSRMLEIGAQAIMYPRCESVAEAKEVIRWTKFAPIGERGFDGANADSDYAGHPVVEYVEHANRETVVIVQLEQQAAVDQADAIAAIPGVDALMLGPADFSILGGFAGQFNDARIAAANQAIAAATTKAGKHWARTVGTPAAAREALEQGAKIIFQGADIAFIRNGLNHLREEYAAIGITL